MLCDKTAAVGTTPPFSQAAPPEGMSRLQAVPSGQGGSRIGPAQAAAGSPGRIRWAVSMGGICDQSTPSGKGRSPALLVPAPLRGTPSVVSARPLRFARRDGAAPHGRGPRGSGVLSPLSWALGAEARVSHPKRSQVSGGGRPRVFIRDSAPASPEALRGRACHGDQGSSERSLLLVSCRFSRGAPAQLQRRCKHVSPVLLLGGVFWQDPYHGTDNAGRPRPRSPYWPQIGTKFMGRVGPLAR
ncbi:hypothetical protein NDU88_005206 [Pleurodeles waltl]|uniref:Uncharacterized protein n=1 Tax=Pleurodeles waltl TaxID=8319 RepID=A0AAV7W9S4_PLEWA|nr:hypothetical protein NDU88_005206 [Pleurodeles waltl]